MESKTDERAELSLEVGGETASIGEGGRGGSFGLSEKFVRSRIKDKK